MDDEILQEFLLESVEALDALDVELIELEQDPNSTALLSSIFRRVHTIKGTCGFLGFAILERVSHVGENLLSKLRDGELSVTPEITSALLEMNDALREMLDNIQDSGQEGEKTYEPLKEVLSALCDGRPVPVSTDEPAPSEEVAGEAPEPVASGASDEAASETEMAPAPAAPETSKPAAPAAPTAEEVAAAQEAEPLVIPDGVRIGDLLLAAGKINRVQLEQALRRQSAGDPRHIGEILVDIGVISPQDVVDVLNSQQEHRNVAEQSIRVDVGLLDRLMNLVGELVLARNQILQVSQSTQDAILTATSQRLDHITTELQGGVMKTRMQPIENAWSKFPRVVRDLSRSLGKQVKLEMVGQETELDKSLLEAIRDPLTHLVRNSVDHGLETPQERLAAGKPEQGTLMLKAYHEGGQVNIEVVDDGRGIDLERVRAKCVENELVTPERAARLTQRELIDMIFAPGFSTAKQVTNVSGRGVGMDVVKTNIEKIGGSIDMQTRPNNGTTVKVKIPLTLAIIPALIITTEGHQYAIPQVNLLELVRLEQSDQTIEWIDGTPVHRLRGKLLPLVFLKDALRDHEDEMDLEGGLNIVVLQAGERHFGLVVDEINDSAEIVVKPLGKLLKDVRCFAGATIMGDGHVALILDVLGIADAAGLKMDQDPLAGLEGFHDGDGQEEAGESRTLLVFELSSDRRFAVPLDEVTRLEEVERGALETSGKHTVVQYRGEIMPIIELGPMFERTQRHAPQTDADGEPLPLQVIVHQHHGDNSVGIAVGRIVDIVEVRLDVIRPVEVPGMAGSAVINGQVTDLVDVNGVLKISGLDRAPAGV